MGFAASQARLQAMVARKSDLELEAQFLESHKMYIANQTSGFFSMSSKLDPMSQAYKVFEARLKHLESIDKILDMHLRRITSQQEALTKEIESTKELVKKNIESSFGLMGGRQ